MTRKGINNMITSSSNQQMKHVIQLNKKAKTRYEQRVFVAEGIKMCMEAPKEDIQAMYVAKSFISLPEHVKMLKEYSYEIVADNVFKAISDTQTPQGILALVRMPEYNLMDILGTKEKKAHLLILENIQDPGNLGTMIRTGEGAGVTGILMNKTTVDVFHPKTIRATMGSLYRVPFYVTEHLEETIVELKKHGISLYAAHLKGKISYEQPDYTKSCGFLIGNEGNGLTDKIVEYADGYIRIPMEGKVESLNATIAATLLMYEVNRQRR